MARQGSGERQQTSGGGRPQRDGVPGLPDMLVGVIVREEDIIVYG